MFIILNGRPRPNLIDGPVPYLLRSKRCNLHDRVIGYVLSGRELL